MSKPQMTECFVSERVTPRSMQITSALRRYLESQSELLAGKGISECLEHARVTSRIDGSKPVWLHIYPVV